MTILDRLLRALAAYPARVAVESTGQVVAHISDRLIASYHPPLSGRPEKLLLIDPREGKYVAVTPAELEGLYNFLGRIIFTGGTMRMKPVECIKAGLPVEQAGQVGPMDLTREDFEFLVRRGWSKASIRRLYNFKNPPAFYARLKALGLHPPAHGDAGEARGEAARGNPAEKTAGAAGGVNVILRFGDAANGYFTTVRPGLTVAELVAIAVERGYRSVLIPAVQGEEVPDAG
ncbi:MAG: hypothetical protein GX410_05140 [Elusimicrobia bacterium]|nr:hypothetical protein [Elusimicrobiota bacterium]